MGIVAAFGPGAAAIAAAGMSAVSQPAHKIRTPGFLVMGLPRSRTAWLANFLTFGGMFCHHDGISKCASDRDLSNLFRRAAQHAAFVGNSDSGQVLIYDRIAALFERSPRLVFVLRSPIYCAQSCEKAGLPISLDDLRALKVRMAKLLAEHQGDSLCVDFDDLDSEPACRAIWNHCCRNQIPFDYQRWQMLSEMNVQMHPATMAVALADRAGNLRRLMT